MTAWIKVYNSMPSHPKVMMAGSQAAWLFVCGCCYSNEHLTDGFIAAHVLPVVAPGVRNPERLAELLVRAGLWHSAEGGWLIHDYEEHQRSSEEIRTTRSWDAERKSLFRDRDLVAAIRNRDGDRCRYCNRPVNWKDRKGQLGGTYDHVIPRGGNTFENVVVACKSCNSRKGARTPSEAGMTLRDLDRDLDPGVDPGSGSDLARVEVEENRREQIKGKNSNAELHSAVIECFAYWQERCNHPQAALSADRRGKIETRLRERARLGDGLPRAIRDIRQAIDGAALAPFIDSKGKRFDDIELICRTGSKLEDFMGRASTNVVRLDRSSSHLPDGQRPSAEWLAQVEAHLAQQREGA